MGRENQYIQLVKVLYCKLVSIGKELQSFPGFEQQTSEVGRSVLQLHHHGPIKAL